MSWRLVDWFMQLLLVAAIVLMLFGIVYPVNALTHGWVEAHVPLRAAPSAEYVASSPVEALRTCGMRQAVDDQWWAVCELPQGQYARAWSRLAFGVKALLYAAIILVIRRVVRQVRDRHSFGGGAADTLRWLALVLLIGLPLPVIIREHAYTVMAHSLGLASYYGYSDHSLLIDDAKGWFDILLWLGSASLALALAEAFRQGERIRKDVEGLV